MSPKLPALMKILSVIGPLSGLIVLFILNEDLMAQGWTGIGVVRPDCGATLRFRAGGELATIRVEEGQKVKRGDIIMELLNRKERAQLERARATVAEYEVRLRKAEKDLEKMKSLTGYVSKQELEDAIYAVDLTKTNLDQARANLVLQEEQLEDTLLRAPFDGIVVQNTIKEGEAVEALRSPVCRLVNLDDVCIEIAVPVKYIGLVSMEQEVPIKLQEESLFKGEEFKGEVHYVSPVMEAGSEMFRVKINIHNHSGLIKPGMVVKALFDFPQVDEGIRKVQPEDKNKTGEAMVPRPERKRKVVKYPSVVPP